MLEAEAEIEGRIAVPGTFGIDENRSFGSAENILRTNVAMDQGLAGLAGALGQADQGHGQVRMPVGGGHQIGFQAHGIENGIGGKGFDDIRPARRRAMNGRQHAADPTGKVRIGAAVAQFQFPVRVAIFLQVSHDQQIGVLVLAQQFRHAAGKNTIDHPHPFGFVVVAFNRGAPNLFHFKLRQGAFDAKLGRGGLNPPDVRRDAAGQRLHGRLLTGLD